MRATGQISPIDEKAYSGTWNRVQQFSQLLGDQHPEVEEILLFGPYLRGEEGPLDFIELLVVLRKSHVPINRRQMYYNVTGFKLPINVYPLTRAEIRAEQRNGNSMLLRIFEESQKLYPASPAGRLRVH